MERTLFLILALTGFLVGAVLAVSDAGTASMVVFAVAGTSLLVWAIALGVYLGIKDAVGEMGGEDRARAETVRRLSAGSSD